jgi:hypothetical protein
MASIKYDYVEYETDNHTFRPDSYKKLVWDLFILILIMYAGITLPFRIAFSIQLSPEMTIFEDL